MIPHWTRLVDTRATMPPPTQITLRPAVDSSPSFFMGEGAGGWGFAARNEKYVGATYQVARRSAKLHRRPVEG